MTASSESQPLVLNYTFTAAEIKALAKFLRQNADRMPAGLEKFYKSLEDSVYNSLSLDEIRNFYS